MSFDWSTDFTTQAGLDMADHGGVGLMLANAYIERIAAIGSPLGSGISLPAAGDDLTEFFKTLQANVDALCTYFVRSTFTAGATDLRNLRYSDVLSINGFPTTNGGGDQANTIIDRNFPYPNGWSRSLPRTIYTLSQAGEDGQRARFEAEPVAIPYYGVLSTDILYGTVIQTPVGELSNSGKMFEFGGSGEWTVSDDQLSSPDILVEFGVLAHAGDYLTGQMVNDIRDALNQCLVSCLGFYNDGRVISGLRTPVYVNTNLSLVAGNTGGAVLTAWDGRTGGQGAYVGGTTWETIPDAGGTPVMLGFISSTGFRFGNANQGAPKIPVVPVGLGYSTAMANPLGQKRDISWYACVYNSGLVSAGGIWDDQGTGYGEYTWQFVCTNAGTTTTALTGSGLFGEYLSPVPDLPLDSFHYHGWDATISAALLNWGVPGGFVYQPGYAGV